METEKQDIAIRGDTAAAVDETGAARGPAKPKPVKKAAPAKRARKTGAQAIVFPAAPVADEATAFRRRKTLRECVDILLALPAPVPADGSAPQSVDNAQLVALALLEKAKSGDVSAIRELRSVLAEEEPGGGLGMWEELVRAMQNEV